MRPKPPSEGVLELDHETVQRIGWVLAALLFGLAIVSFVGEIRGWWGLFGEIGMIVGTVGGLFISFANLLLGADGKSQRVVHEAVASNGETLMEQNQILDEQTGMLGEQTGMLDQLTETMERQTEVLEDIRDGV